MARCERCNCFMMFKTPTGYCHNCSNIIEKGKPTFIKQNYSVGSYVYYGTYPQTADGNDSTPIEWLVLDYDAKNKKALLISRYGLDCKMYDSGHADNVTWETCTLRTWLNGTFLSKAFNKAEQELILNTDVDNSKSQCYGGWITSGGNDTQDKIFLLSYGEANKYLNVQFFRVSGANENIKSRVAATAYATAQGARTDSDYKTVEGAASGRWWLRSPGWLQDMIAEVDINGSLNNIYFFYIVTLVRPALWLDLSGI